MEDGLVPEIVKLTRQVTELTFGTAGAVMAFVGLGQASCHHRHDLLWAEIDYFLQVRQVHIETLNNMREDLLDLYEMDGRRLDTRMIVATLLLAIGFGFVVEGTFPAPDPGVSSSKRGLYEAQHNARIVYSITAAFALLCPFWSMLSIMECRRRLDFFMDAFSDKFYFMLKKRFRSFECETRSTRIMHHSNLVTYTKGLPKDPNPNLARLYHFEREDGCSSQQRQQQPQHRGLFGCCARRHHMTRSETLEGQLQTLPSIGKQTPGDFDIILQLHSHYVTWWYDWCRFFMKVSSICTWLAMVFNVLCCSILLGMYYQFHYPDTPKMWQAYSSILLSGLAAALTCTGFAHGKGPRLPGGKLDAKKKHCAPVPGGIPPWMEKAPDATLTLGSPLLEV
uniref:Uncharacterized protein n=1 Tax=Alexandrium monilatum TaxID=311494 RepID=A0A7S4V4I4_9DINO